MEVLLAGIANYLIVLSESNPKVVAVLAIAYMVGVVLKVLRSAIESFVLESPSKSDDLKLEEIKKNPIAKVALFVADLLIRFKKPEIK